MKIYQLKIQLEPRYIKPPIWRKILVRENCTFLELHKIIQVTVGWANAHLWDFDYDKYSITLPNIEDEWRDVIDASELEISKVLSKEKDKLKYTYDYGDNWEHIITLEKIKIDDKKQAYPICIKGKNACPPEDCGGTWGYLNLLEIISNKKHPEYKQMLAWLDDDFNPKELNIKEINAYLQNKSG